MPSIRYMNQSGPFWDFISNLEDQGSSHPFFANRGHQGHHGHAGRPPFPFEAGGFHPFAFGHPGAWGQTSDPRPQETGGQRSSEQNRTSQNEKKDDAMNDGDSDDETIRTPTTEAEKAAEEEKAAPEGQAGPSNCNRQRRHGGCHGYRRGGPWARGGGGHCGGNRGGAWRGFGGHPFNLANLGEYIDGNVAGLFGQQQPQGEAAASQDFRPDADVFDTEAAYVIHLSLPGAQKEDVGVNWDADKSELSIAGVVYRPGVDEDMLNTLALDERRIGAFERKIRLGTRASPAAIDPEAITAKLEDGVLRVDVPKMDKDYVEIKKVDVL